MGLLGGSVADKFIGGFVKGFVSEKLASISGFFDGLFGSNGTISQNFSMTAGLRTGKEYGSGAQQGLEQSKNNYFSNCI